MTSYDLSSNINLVAVNCAKVYQEDFIQSLEVIVAQDDKNHRNYRRYLPKYLQIVIRTTKIHKPDTYNSLPNIFFDKKRSMEIIKTNSILSNLFNEEFIPLKAPPPSGKNTFRKFIKMKGALSIKCWSKSDSDCLWHVITKYSKVDRIKSDIDLALQSLKCKYTQVYNDCVEKFHSHPTISKFVLFTNHSQDLLNRYSKSTKVIVPPPTKMHHCNLTNVLLNNRKSP